MSKLFEKDNWNLSDFSLIHYLYSAAEVKNLHPEDDRLLLENIARNAEGSTKKMALRVLGVSEVPKVDDSLISDGIYDEPYWLYREQVKRITDPEILIETLYEASGMIARFAFCYYTGYAYPSPEEDAYSHRTFECGRFPGNTDAVIENFCVEMVRIWGPFMKEARECLYKNAEDKAVFCDYWINDPVRFNQDREMRKEVYEIGAFLGDRGRFMVKRPDETGKLSVMVEADDELLKEKCLILFSRILRNKGYITEIH